jgi:hypothetical protein
MNPLINFIFKLLIPMVLLWLTIWGVIEASGQVRAVPAPADLPRLAQ